MAYVYRHIRFDKNEPFYIGISRGAKPNNHRAKSSQGRNVIWKNIANKTEWDVEIMMDGLTWGEAKLKEIEFVKLYGRINKKTGILSNMTDGGDGGLGVLISEESRIKRSEISRKKGISKETRKKMAEKLRGRPQPEWQRKILSEAAKGKDVYWCKKKVDQYDMNGNFIKTFDSITDVTKTLGINNIVKVLQGKRSHAGGFVFLYHGQKFEKINVSEGRKPFLRRKVVNLETGDIYDTIADAASKNNIHYHSLKQMLKNKLKKGKFEYL
jgi:hypothetical protein